MRDVYIPQEHPPSNAVAKLGWAAFAFISATLACLALLAIGLGPAANRSFYVVCAGAWALCTWLSVRGFNRKGL